MMPEKNQYNTLVNWIAEAAIPSFLLQLLLSTLGAIIMGTVAVFIPSLLLAALTRNSSGGNFADHVLSQPPFKLLSEPYFIAPIFAGFFLGRLGGRFFRSVSAGLVWIVPAAMLVMSMASGPSTNVWNNYFGAGCGASECAYEVLLTAPFYTSVAYTVGWTFESLRRRKIAA